MCENMVFNVLFGQMERLEELLPGIEDFLCKTLANENLSEVAEQQRQYFVERLDILQLPPSVPPRCSASKLETAAEIHRIPESPEKTIGTPELQSPTSIEDDDFVAYQRELSRSFLSAASSEEKLRKKLYDDIDHQQNNSATIDPELNFYEIPVPKSTETENQTKENDYEETLVPGDKGDDTGPVPPPLPPRRDRTASDAQSRSSCGSILEDVKPNLPLRPQLTPKSEILKGSLERLVDDDQISHGDDLDGTSYESYDDEDLSKFNIQLPKVKKSSKHKKVSKSRSSKEWDLNVPFKCLEEVTLSGELLYKGKLSWTRKICALSEGRLVCYKPDKCEQKPSLVIQLTGYKCSFSERENRKLFDIKLTHPSLELHLFAVDIKEWASLWCEYINAMSEGRPPPGLYQHLTRSTTFNGAEKCQIYGSRTDIRMSSSQGSLNTSFDALDREFVRSNSFNKPKVSRMGSFAVRASQFFETIGKKTGRKLSSVSSLSNLRERPSTVSSYESACSPAVTPDIPVFLPEIPAIPTRKPVTHSGYLCIYSNFNRRKWGKRWCLVRENSFECYRNESSTVCELDFLLRFCKLRRAVTETKSEFGLMLVENSAEKITIEPLSREEMGGWLKVLMNETSTELLPEGLDEFWVEEESPYHDINPRDLTSPTSDAGGYSSIKDHLNYKSQKLCSEENEDSALDLTSDLTLVSENQIFASPIQPNSAEETHQTQREITLDDPKIPGEITGDLYSQVRRKSSTGSVTDESQLCEERKRDNGNRAPEHVFSFSDHDISEMGDNCTLDFNSEPDSMFAEILQKISNINNNLNECEDSLEDQTDSAVCSENNSLERKTHHDRELHSISENTETLSQGTDIQVSPLEDFCPEGHTFDTADNKDYRYKNHISAKNESDQSNFPVQVTNQSSSSYHFTQTVISQSNRSVQAINQSIFSTNFELTNGHTHLNTHLTVDPKSRDQCDSAIFESESILEDLDGSPKALSCKIEQLRTHLVELKKTRISVRNQKEQSLRDSERKHLEAEYIKLDDECRTIGEEISLLEDRLSLHPGYHQSVDQ